MKNEQTEKIKRVIKTEEYIETETKQQRDCDRGME
jgi:hypothetical protein